MTAPDAQLDPWRRGLAADDAPAVRELFASVRAADRRGPHPGDLPGPDTQVLLARRAGRPVGIVWRSGDDPAELVVNPADRRRGIGSELARTVLDGAATGLGGEAPDAPGGIWAHGTLPAAAALARSLGAVPVRTMLQMRRDLRGPFDDVAVPDGVRIRTFVPGQDEDAFLAVNARAFAWHPEQGRLDRDGLAEEMRADWFDPAGFFLAVRAAGAEGANADAAGAAVPNDDLADAGTTGAGTVLGFHWTKVHTQDPTPPSDAGPADAAGPVGEVYVLGVDPDSPIRRLGAPLTLVGLAHLAGRGLRQVMLYVESDNDRALRLYRRLGFAEYAVDTVFARA